MRGAWVTLATNDSYSLGALVLAHSLKQVGTTQELAILVTPGVTNSMRARLSQVFNLVQEVNVLDSRDQANLRLLQRPELGITFTKLHCWKLTQYEKCVFLDADTLVLQNCDELFDREELSAAPDVGWPDCFNSGVFVYRPSGETYDKLIQFALDKGSFDGGDQGLLNLYFSDWAHKDISKHLPFIYNVCSTAFYSYLPAFKQFGKDVKIIHFIGNAKPWLQYFDTETQKVRPSGEIGHLAAILQKWWNIFCSLIHPNLSPDMSGLAGAFAKLTLGQQRTPEQEALEDSLRRQNWEQGNIDYLGRDSFENIWNKICETLSKGPQEPAVEEVQVASQPGLLLAAAHQPSEEKAVDAAASTKEENKEQPPEAQEPVVLPRQTPPLEVLREEIVSAPKSAEVVPPAESALPLAPSVPSAPEELPATPAASAVADKSSCDLAISATSPSEGQPPTDKLQKLDVVSQLSEALVETSEIAKLATDPAPLLSPETPTALKEASAAPACALAAAAPLAPLEVSAVPVSASTAETSEAGLTSPAVTTPTVPVKDALISAASLQTGAPSPPTKISVPPLNAPLLPPQIPTPPQTPTPPEQISAILITAQTEGTPTPPKQTPTHSEQTPTPPEQTPAPPEQTPTSPEQTSTLPVQTSTLPVQTSKSSVETPTCPQQTPTPPLQSSAPSVQPESPKISTPLAEVSSLPSKSTASPSQTLPTSTTTPQVSASSLPAAAVPVTTPTPAAETLAPQIKDSAGSAQATSPPSESGDACPIVPPPRKSGGNKKQGKSKK